MKTEQKEKNCLFEMKIHKTVRDIALKHKIRIRRDHNGIYFVLDEFGDVEFFSYSSTAKSGVATIKKYLRYLNK